MTVVLNNVILHGLQATYDSCTWAAAVAAAAVTTRAMVRAMLSPALVLPLVEARTSAAPASLLVAFPPLLLLLGPCPPATMTP